MSTVCSGHRRVEIAPKDFSVRKRKPHGFENTNEFAGNGWLGRKAHRLLAIFALLTCFIAGATANPFYVSPNGNDGNPGTEAAPFRTIQKARDAVRGISTNQNSDIVVYLRGGRYELSSPLQFNSNDAGRNGHRIIYRAYPGEIPVLSGGRQVTGWTHVGGGIYRAPAPGNAFRQLFVNDRWATRARTPNAGSFYRVQGWNDWENSIRINANEISNWNNLGQVEMVVMKHWHQSRFRIGSFSVSGNTATVFPRDPERTVEWLVQWPNREPNQAYYFENALEFLDQPGEWYLDTGAGHVYYMPHPGENLASVEVVAPRLERLVDIQGAHNLTFEGIHFKHTTWNAPSSEGFIGQQASGYRVLATGNWIPSAVFVRDAHRVRFERNVFRNLGAGGLELHSGTYRSEIVGNVVADVAANGISVYTFLGNRNPEPHIRSRHDVVRNNYVTRVGQDYTGAVAIYGSYTEGLIVEHNEISDSPYTAINIGWGWTNLDTGTRDNRVRYNKIHGVMNLLDDGAGIYTLSKQSNTLIEENHIHDLTRNPWAGYYEIAALYLDEQSEGITMRNNVVERLSGVMIWKENRANMGGNSVHNNGANIPNKASIVNNAGLQSSFLDIRNLANGNPSSSQPASPWGGSPSAIPGRIQAENFDHGGQGVAYHDTTSGNTGGAYRTGESVDIEPATDQGGGYNVGWTVSGEWLQYTVNVQDTGTFDLAVRVAAINQGRHFRVLIDGQDVSGRIDVPDTGGWQAWQTVTIPGVFLSKGKRTMRVRIDDGGFNLNWLEFIRPLQPVTVALTAPAANSQFTSGQSIAIGATVQDDSNRVARIEFLAGSQKIGESTSNPHSFSWNNAPSGSHVLSARAVLTDNQTILSSPVTIIVGEAAGTGPSEPFHGSPAAIPGRIQAEEFDHGGPNVAYFDTTSANQGGAFRPNEYVDIEATADTGGGYNLGWTQKGEWLNYTVNVAETGTYELRIRAATPHDGRFLHIRSNGQNVSGRIDMPNTGGWQTWQTVTVSGITLQQGVQTLRLVFDIEQINVNYFEFQASGNQGQGSLTYQGWSENHFNAAELNNPQISGDAGDPDGDGVPNLMEYAFGGDPQVPGSARKPRSYVVSVGGTRYLAITYFRNPDASEVEFFVESSTDMANWANGSEVVHYFTETLNGLEVVTYRDKTPLTDFTHRYLRVRLERTSG